MGPTQPAVITNDTIRAYLASIGIADANNNYDVDVYRIVHRARLIEHYPSMRTFDLFAAENSNLVAHFRSATLKRFTPSDWQKIGVSEASYAAHCYY